MCDKVETMTARERVRLAENMKTSPQTLTLLAEDHVDEVRLAVAENISTPLQALELLSQDCMNFIRAAVARNSSTPSLLRRVIHNNLRYA